MNDTVAHEEERAARRDQVVMASRHLPGGRADFPISVQRAKVGSHSARQQYAHAVPETSYAPCGDLSLAYQVFGDGPIELVCVGPFVSHVELAWTMPEYKAFFDQLATFCRVLVFDKAGVGLSDPVPKVRTLDDRANEIEAVMDAAGFGKAVVYGLQRGRMRGNCFRGNTTGANAGADPQRRGPVLGRRRVGRHGSRPSRGAGARPCRAG